MDATFSSSRVSPVTVSIMEQMNGCGLLFSVDFRPVTTPVYASKIASRNCV